MQPVENAVQVLSQDQIIVDLVAGYEARLVVDGIELPTTVIGQSDVDPDVQAQPGQQVDVPTRPCSTRETPSSRSNRSRAPSSRHSRGTHKATVYFWKIEEGPDQASTYSWTFEVI